MNNLKLELQKVSIRGYVLTMREEDRVKPLAVQVELDLSGKTDLERIQHIATQVLTGFLALRQPETTDEAMGDEK